MKKLQILITILLGLVSMLARVMGAPSLKTGETLRISEPIDLKGQEWQLPKGAILIGTKRGCIKNGLITGNKSSLRNLVLCDVKMRGQFDEVDVTLALDTDSLVMSGTSFKRLALDGNGHRITVSCFGIQRQADVILRNIVFDCKNSTGPFLYPISDGRNKIILDNCKFTNIPEIELLCIRGMINPEIRNCSFYGLVTKNAKRHRNSMALIRFYGCYGSICFDRNTISKCFGIAVNGIGHSEKTNNKVCISNNVIDNVTNGGVVFNGGITHNVTMENNHISNVHCLGSQFDKEVSCAENAAINFHGFKNLRILNNEITECPLAHGLDLDGTLSSDTSVCKGDNVVIKRNKWERVLTTILFGVRNAQITGNTFVYTGENDIPAAQNGLSLNACHDIAIVNNKITSYRPEKKEAYPIVIGQNRNRTSGSIVVKGNTIKSDGEVYMVVGETFTGTLKQNKNKTNSTRTHNNLRMVDRTK